VGKPNKRDLLEASGKYISAAKLHFPAKENSLTAPKIVPTVFCLGKPAKIVVQPC
jgi:hypothetical protein